MAYPYAKTVIYADDMSLLITTNYRDDIQAEVYSMLHLANEWFSANELSLNVDKTKVIKFSANHLQNHQSQITYQNISIAAAVNAGFLGLVLSKRIN
jgi:hypothetical protein